MKSELNPGLPSRIVTNMDKATIDALRFDVAKIAATLPETATTLLACGRQSTLRAMSTSRILFPTRKNSFYWSQAQRDSLSEIEVISRTRLVRRQVPEEHDRIRPYRSVRGCKDRPRSSPH